MGCANSKQKGCNHCNAPYYPVPKSYSMHVHHPPQSKGDSYHVVALTSTTLGSLDLVSHNHGNGFSFSNGKVSDSDRFMKEEKEVENETKTWSNMIEQKLPKAIPKTLITTTTIPSEPETINTWELMEGLEDTSPFQSPNHLRNFSFDINVDPHKPNDSLKELQIATTEEGSNLKDSVSDFDDSQVVSSFQKSVQEKQESIMARKGLSFDEEKKINDDVSDFKLDPYEKKDKVVLYFTSLRGVRKTYEDCCHVKLILKGFDVKLDERDVSMHSGFKEELKELLGDLYGKGGLPRLFIGKNYIGGAEEIKKLHEDGKLEKLLDCCDKNDDNEGDVGGVCEACGDIRFVPCETCYGSCKIYYEGEEEDGEVGECGFQRCPDCNENGLICCPMCCF